MATTGRGKSPGRERKKGTPVQAEEAPVQAQTASMLWGMPWMRVLIALLFSVVLQVAVYVYINTSTREIETKLKAFLGPDHPQYHYMVEISDTIRSNQDFLFMGGLVIDGVCFCLLIAVLFLESAVMCGLRLFWGFVSHRYTIACACVAAIYALFF